jgi:hypothetical protein
MQPLGRSGGYCDGETADKCTREKRTDDKGTHPRREFALHKDSHSQNDLRCNSSVVDNYAVQHAASAEGTKNADDLEYVSRT